MTILGALLAASTAVYGLVGEKDSYYLLPVLSVIWLVGFLHIYEKRYWIGRAARYLREEVETKESGLYWQNWLAENENSAHKWRRALSSPLKLEFALLTVTCAANTGIAFSGCHPIIGAGCALVLALALAVGLPYVVIYYRDRNRTGRG